LLNRWRRPLRRRPRRHIVPAHDVFRAIAKTFLDRKNEAGFINFGNPAIGPVAPPRPQLNTQRAQAALTPQPSFRFRPDPGTRITSPSRPSQTERRFRTFPKTGITK
jgi:hypothetical protein